MSGQTLPPYAVLLPLAPWEQPGIVREALASLEKQTLAPAQVVVSCDGRLPIALAAVVAAAALPIDCIEGSGGEGVGRVLARGLLHCRHELVVRADADDVSLPERCRQLVEAMVADAALAVMGSWLDEFTTSADVVVAQRQVPLQAKAIARGALRRNPFNHPTVIFRRGVVLTVGNYRHRPGFEDYDLWLRILRLGCGCANLAEPLVRARVGAAHLGRRHGWSYARREAQFFLQCSREGLLPWWAVIQNLLIRMPLRLLPSPLLQATMTVVRG